MSNEPSPRPWRVETNRFGQHYIVCESGSGDPVRDYIAGPIQNESDAALIVDAVNERARLRDIVREALPFIEGAIDGVSTILGDAEMSKAAGECGAPPKDVQEAFVADGRRVLREARAAIGENAPRTEEKGGDK